IMRLQQAKNDKGGQVLDVGLLNSLYQVLRVFQLDISEAEVEQFYGSLESFVQEARAFFREVEKAKQDDDGNDLGFEARDGLYQDLSSLYSFMEDMYEKLIERVTAINKSLNEDDLEQIQISLGSCLDKNTEKEVLGEKWQEIKKRTEQLGKEINQKKEVMEKAGLLVKVMRVLNGSDVLGKVKSVLQKGVIGPSKELEEEILVMLGFIKPINKQDARLKAWKEVSKSGDIDIRKINQAQKEIEKKMNEKNLQEGWRLFKKVVQQQQEQARRPNERELFLKNLHKNLGLIPAPALESESPYYYYICGQRMNKYLSQIRESLPQTPANRQAGLQGSGKQGASVELSRNERRRLFEMAYLYLVNKVNQDKLGLTDKEIESRIEEIEAKIEKEKARPYFYVNPQQRVADGCRQQMNKSLLPIRAAALALRYESDEAELTALREMWVANEREQMRRDKLEDTRVELMFEGDRDTIAEYQAIRHEHDKQRQEYEKASAEKEKLGEELTQILEEMLTLQAQDIQADSGYERYQQLHKEYIEIEQKIADVEQQKSSFEAEMRKLQQNRQTIETINTLKQYRRINFGEFKDADFSIQGVKEAWQNVKKQIAIQVGMVVGWYPSQEVGQAASIVEMIDSYSKEELDASEGADLAVAVLLKLYGGCAGSDGASGGDDDWLNALIKHLEEEHQSSKELTRLNKRIEQLEKDANKEPFYNQRKIVEKVILSRKIATQQAILEVFEEEGIELSGKAKELRLLNNDKESLVIDRNNVAGDSAQYRALSYQIDLMQVKINTADMRNELAESEEEFLNLDKIKEGLKDKIAQAKKTNDKVDDLEKLLWKIVKEYLDKGIDIDILKAKLEPLLIKEEERIAWLRYRAAEVKNKLDEAKEAKNSQEIETLAEKYAVLLEKLKKLEIKKQVFNRKCELERDRTVIMVGEQRIVPGDGNAQAGRVNKIVGIVCEEEISKFVEQANKEVSKLEEDGKIEDNKEAKSISGAQGKIEELNKRIESLEVELERVSLPCPPQTPAEMQKEAAKINVEITKARKELAQEQESQKNIEEQAQKRKDELDKKIKFIKQWQRLVKLEGARAQSNAYSVYTAAYVRMYQQVNGLDATGAWDRKTSIKMYEDYKNIVNQGIEKDEEFLEKEFDDYFKRVRKAIVEEAAALGQVEPLDLMIKREIALAAAKVFIFREVISDLESKTQAEIDISFEDIPAYFREIVKKIDERIIVLTDKLAKEGRVDKKITEEISSLQQEKDKMNSYINNRPLGITCYFGEWLPVDGKREGIKIVLDKNVYPDDTDDSYACLITILAHELVGHAAVYAENWEYLKVHARLPLNISGTSLDSLREVFAAMKAQDFYATSFHPLMPNAQLPFLAVDPNALIRQANISLLKQSIAAEQVKKRQQFSEIVEIKYEIEAYKRGIEFLKGVSEGARDQVIDIIKNKYVKLEQDLLIKAQRQLAIKLEIEEQDQQDDFDVSLRITSNGAWGASRIGFSEFFLTSSYATVKHPEAEREVGVHNILRKIDILKKIGMIRDVVGGRYEFIVYGINKTRLRSQGFLESEITSVVEIWEESKYEYPHQGVDLKMEIGD
ncbi:MAG: hypothetical protein JSV34_06015, partial [Candidatus Omnitrophota bacterium]